MAVLSLGRDKIGMSNCMEEAEVFIAGDSGGWCGCLCAQGSRGAGDELQ